MSSLADRTWRVVAGALRSAIHEHGPITDANIESAVKRVVSQLRAAADNDMKIIGVGDQHATCRAAVEAANKRTQKLRFGHERLLDRYELLRAEHAKLLGVELDKAVGE